MRAPASFIPTGTRGSKVIRNHKIRKARAMWIAEGVLRGRPHRDTAKALNISERHVIREMNHAIDKGWLEDIRKRMQAPLERAPEVYNEILSTPAATLHEHAKGYAIKTDVLKTLATGLGAFRAESQQTKVLNLEAYHAAAPALPESSIEAEVVRPMLEAPADPDTDTEPSDEDTPDE